MAGFGFSPSDIVEFGKFANKVRIAIKEEGGSKSEYFEALGWCDNFQDVLKRIKGLQLSNVTDNFADQFQNQAQQIADFIVLFKTRIKKYEKATEKKSTKG